MAGKFYEGRKRAGYSIEEAYFFEENKRLLRELRIKNGRSSKERSDEDLELEEAEVIEASDRFGESARRSHNEPHSSKHRKAA